MEAEALFQSFVVDVLCRCSEPEKFRTWSMLAELDRSVGSRGQNYVWELLQDSRRQLDYDPPMNWNIPAFRDNLVHLKQICENYIAAVPVDMRDEVHARFSMIVDNFKKEYLDVMLETIDRVLPAMRGNAYYALKFLAQKHPKVFWRCFWETVTGMASMAQHEADEVDRIRLLHFLELPISHFFAESQEQEMHCLNALQRIIDKREKQPHHKRILHFSGPSFQEALRITNIEIHPHESSLSDDTRGNMEGILTRRSYAARRRRTSQRPIVFSRFMPP
jgi:hypothetical protein